ncbi:MAG: serine/threonine-protein phosphatase [Solobacterium sp.]|nr:serine/threonine-protein phosphatase [Solobacterium sp.]
MDYSKITNKTEVLRTSMAANIIFSVVLLLVLFGLISGTAGLLSFTAAFQKEYTTTTWHMADTASTLVNGDHLDDYLEGKEMEEYALTEEYLDAYCRKMYVSLIYIIRVDTSDYGRFVSVFNEVNNEVDDSSYTPWELGYKRDTTNSEYRQKYKAIYEEGSPCETLYRIKVTDGQHPHITTMVPVKGSDGEVTGILCMQRPVSELLEARRPYLLNIAIAVIVLAALASVAASYYMKKQFVEPVSAISAEAARFARENTPGEKLGDISKFRELYNLGRSIDTMEKEMVQNIENLTAITAEKERISTELTLANRLQTTMMPHIFPAFPYRPEFDVYAVMEPAKEVGGDFYDFFLIDDDHLCLVVADVSGKGIPAALFMMASKIIIQSCAMLGKSASETLTKTNEAICSNNQEEMFVTVWLGILEISTGKLTAANAGHEYPVLRHAGGSFELVRDRHGFVVGGLEGSVYTEYELRLEPGTKLFLYTDGLTEATNADMEMFGTERITEALNRDPDAEPIDILANVKTAVNDFVKDAEQFDDLTMLCIEYRGNTNV